MSTEIDYLKKEIEQREQLTKSAIQSKKNTIEKLQRLKIFVDEKYKDKEITDKMIKQLYSLYRFCQISDKTINTKGKLIKLLKKYDENNKYCSLFGCYGLKEFNDFDEKEKDFFDLENELAKLFENKEIFNKKIYLDTYHYEYAYDYEYEAYGNYETANYFNVFYCDKNALKKDIFSCEEIMQLIANKKIIILGSSQTKMLREYDKKILKKLKKCENLEEFNNKIKNIENYSIKNYVNYITSHKKDNSKEINDIIDSITGGLWDKKCNLQSKISQIYPQINQIMFEKISKMIENQIKIQNKKITEIKKEYSEYMKQLNKYIQKEYKKDKYQKEMLEKTKEENKKNSPSKLNKEK